MLLSSAVRRGYQDYSSWQSFLCQSHWEDIFASPQLAINIAASHLHDLNLVNPCESTSGDVAAGIAVAMHGASGCAILPTTELQQIYEDFKAREQFQFAWRVQSFRLQPLEPA